jgi:phospholipid/cholesterol/gamma-HCH transport system substrate-binding protein
LIMTLDDKKTQLRVGIFVAIGLFAVAMLVVYFGRLGDGFRNYYTVRVEYPNASGLFKDVPVLLAGAKIGLVENDPVILPDMNGVYVNLKIYENVEIPSKSKFTVGSSGLLGDKFVQVNLLEGAKESPPIAPGTTIEGEGETGLADIFAEAGPIVGEVRAVVKKLDNIAAKLDKELLKKSTMEDLNATLANLNATSASFAEASKKIDGVVIQAGEAIEGGKATFVSATEAADELQNTLKDVRGLLKEAKNGRGALGLLLTNKEVANNLRALVINLRQHGILWYKDRSDLKE